MTTEQMRAAILSVYPGWTKVRTMTDGQIVAIFRRLQNQGKINL